MAVLEAAAGSGVRSCDVGLLEALPEPARRFLSHAVPEGLELPRGGGVGDDR
ncbi:MAG: hypothetical protein R2789_18580 [Microthrixaceae bacterium]